MLRLERLAAGEPNNIFFRSLMRSESRGHSQEKECRGAIGRFGAPCCRSLAVPAACWALATGSGPSRSRSRTTPAAPADCRCFAANAAAMLLRRSRSRKRGVLLVDLPLLLRRRIGARDIEASVLHEIVIGVAAAGLAASGEFRVAFDERCGLLLGRGLLGDIGTFLEIGRRVRPPLRMRAQWLQRHAAGERGHQRNGATRCDHGRFSQRDFERDIIRADLRRLSPLFAGLSLRKKCGLSRVSCETFSFVTGDTSVPDGTRENKVVREPRSRYQRPNRDAGTPTIVRHDGAKRRFICKTNSEQSCCTRDEGGPLGPGLQDQGSNHRKLLQHNGWGGERCGKGGE